MDIVTLPNQVMPTTSRWKNTSDDCTDCSAGFTSTSWSRVWPGEVIFGATAIPSESWPENNQFRLTDDPDRVNLAIKAARNLSGYWSNELLCTDQHPILA